MYEDILEMLQERKKYLKALISDKSTAIRSAPAGKLRISGSGTNKRYYIRTDPSNTNGRYINKTNKSLAYALAQKDYDAKILNGAQKELSFIEQVQKLASRPLIEQFYENYNAPRRALITPIRLPDKEYIDAWESVSWQKKPITINSAEYYTAKGEQVRSKSEILIADTLARFQVPYRYEYPLTIGNATFHPDFTTLHVRKRQVVIWEHFGMLDHPDYARNAIEKIETYEMNGYYPGNNLIFTFETEKTPLNTKIITQFIKTYLL